MAIGDAHSLSFHFHHAKHEPGTAMLEVRGLCIHYDQRAALEDLTFTMDAGERLAVVGPNGAGKSTLFKAIAGLIKPTRGEIRVYGHEPLGHICIAYLPQRSQVDWSFPVSVMDVVMMGRISQLGLFRHPSRKDRDLVQQCLNMVGLADLAGRHIRDLSGGQQQRMFIARALAMEAELMLMDEPLAGLDMHSQEGILSVLDALQARRVTVLVALHDLNLAAEKFPRAMLLNRRIISLGPPARAFADEHLLAAYGANRKAVATPAGTLLVSDTCCEGEHGHD